MGHSDIGQQYLYCQEWVSYPSGLIFKSETMSPTPSHVPALLWTLGLSNPCALRLPRNAILCPLSTNPSSMQCPPRGKLLVLPGRKISSYSYWKMTGKISINYHIRHPAMLLHRKTAINCDPGGTGHHRKFLLHVSDRCWCCGTGYGTLLHIWWTCTTIAEFWKTVYAITTKVTTCRLSHPSLPTSASCPRWDDALSQISCHSYDYCS